MGLGAKNFERDSLRAARLGDWGWGLGEVGGICDIWVFFEIW